MKRSVPAAGLDIEVALWSQGYHRVVGVDEAGRGPLAGPVVVAGVILNPNTSDSLGVDDSKKLSESRREALFEAIISGSIGHQIEVLGNIEIDELNILNATLKGMQLAVEALKPVPDFVLIDGNRLPKLTLPAQAVVKGDQKREDNSRRDTSTSCPMSVPSRTTCKRLCPSVNCASTESIQRTGLS